MTNEASTISLATSSQPISYGQVGDHGLEGHSQVGDHGLEGQAEPARAARWESRATRGVPE